MPCRASFPVTTATCDVFSSTAHGASGWKQRAQDEGSTCSQDNDFGSLSVALSTARGTKQLEHVLGISDGKAAAVYKLSNGQDLVSLTNVRQRQ